MLSKLIYYGFSKNTYNSVKTHCDKSNVRNIGITLTLFIVMMLAAWGMSSLYIIPFSQRHTYLTFFLVSLVFQILILVLRDNTVRINRIIVYLVIVLLTVFSIALSKEEPFLVSAIFPVFMFLGGVAFIDNMGRFAVCVIAETVAFTVCSYFNKPPSIARYDLIYALIFAVITLIFHYRFQRGVVQQYLSYERTLEVQQDLEVQSSFDALSGLLVRGRFFSLADSVLRGPDRSDYVALCILDLDSFKQINDKFGHQMGDKAIQLTADAIWQELGSDLTKKWEFCERAVRNEESFAGRLGGDEFVIFLRESGTWEETQTKLRHILDSLNAVELGELKGIHASFGVTEITDNDRDIDSVYARADNALYEAKTSGKNRIVKG